MEPEVNNDTELTVLCFTATVDEGTKDYCIVVKETLDN